MNDKQFEVIIIGGSYSGLAAAMALGRALRRALIIDDGKPCNRQTPFSHNFLTNDGTSPAKIAANAKQEVSKYGTLAFLQDLAIGGIKTDEGFEIQLASGKTFSTSRLIFATGIKDIIPAINGLAACWGISVLHCPYCHGYEVRNAKTGILANGEVGFDFCRLIANWTADLSLFTNGTSTLDAEQLNRLKTHNIPIIEGEIHEAEHANGYLKNIVFKDGSKYPLTALYTPSTFEQNCQIPLALGCELTEDRYLEVDPFQETTVNGVYACGDNASRMRTVANSVAMGTTAGMSLSKKMILDQF